MMKSRVVAEPLASALEDDCIYRRHTYCYTENRPQVVAWAKRQIHKRARRRDQREAREALRDLMGGVCNTQ